MPGDCADPSDMVAVFMRDEDCPDFVLFNMQALQVFPDFFSGDAAIHENFGLLSADNDAIAFAAGGQDSGLKHISRG